MKSKTTILTKLLWAVLLVSCNTKSKNSEQTTNSEVAPQKEASLETERYTLLKVPDDPNREDGDLIVYEHKTATNSLTFYTKYNLDYGVLEEYSLENDNSDYYWYPKPEKIASQLNVSLDKALFSKKSNEIDPEVSEYTEVDVLLQNYVILGFRGDPSYPTYAIINFSTQAISYFSTHSEFEVSSDEKFLIGWHDSKTTTKVEDICPEHRANKEYYVVTEEFRHNLETGEETLTGKLGCGFVQ